MSGLEISGPVAKLDLSMIAALPAQLGVYELLDGSGATVKFGYAGGRTAFGMRSALETELASASPNTQVRYEFTTAYLTRFQELLMAHAADHGELPMGNVEPPAGHHEPLGRLSRSNAPATKDED